MPFGILQWIFPPIVLIVRVFFQLFYFVTSLAELHCWRCNYINNYSTTVFHTNNMIELVNYVLHRTATKGNPIYLKQ